MLASARAKLAIALVAVTSAACSAPPEDTPRELSVYTRPAHVGALSSFVAYLPLSAAHLREAADPAAALRQVEPGTAAVAVDIGALTCRECYRLEAVEPLRYIVRAGDKLGAQYGLAALLEHAGLRFYHPFRSYVPTALSWPREHIVLIVMFALGGVLWVSAAKSRAEISQAQRDYLILDG